MKVLIGSQTWAWGPASKAEVIGYALTNKYKASVDFVGDKVSYDFCLLSGSFENCKCIEDQTDFSSIDFNLYDFVISVMNPYLAIYAFKNNKKVFWVDSMSWIWNWNNYVKIKEKYDKIIDRSTSEIIDLMKNMHHYDCKIFGIICSSWLFIQGNYYNREIAKEEGEYVGAIVNTSLRREMERDTILISLSGQLCPYMNKDKAIEYSNNVQIWLKDIIDKYKSEYKIIIAGNVEVIKYTNRQEGVKYKHFNHKDFLITLNRCKAIFCPSGFTTIYESAAYGVPMFFLPETHDGNAYEFLLITNGASDIERANHFPNLLLDVESKTISNIVDENITMDRLTQRYNELKYSLEEQRKQKEKIALIMEKIEHEKDISAKQFEIINRTISINGTIDKIINKILEII